MVPVDHPDGRVVCFIIPQAEGLPVNYEGVYYTRIGAQTKHMPALELQRLMAESKPARWLDEICLSGLTPLEVMNLLEVHRFYQMMKAPWPGDLDEVMQGLAAEGMLVPEQTRKEYAITKMGMLLLAKSFEGCPDDIAWKSVRIVKYKGKSNTDDILFDETFDKGLATGFDGMVDKAMSRMESHYERKGSQRHVIDFVPRDAVRELLANAIIHRDFNVAKKVLLEIFSDRVKITNAGQSLTAPERMIDKNQTRNMKLLEVMSKCGLSEDLGSGIDKVVEAVEYRHAPPPSFESQEGATEVTLYSEKFKMEREHLRVACYQHCALKHVRKQFMTNSSFRERLNLDEASARTVSKILSGLVEKKIIKKVSDNGDSKKYARYVPYWA